MPGRIYCSFCQEHNGFSKKTVLDTRLLVHTLLALITLCLVLSALLLSLFCPVYFFKYFVDTFLCSCQPGMCLLGSTLCFLHFFFLKTISLLFPVHMRTFFVFLSSLFSSCVLTPPVWVTQGTCTAFAVTAA